MGANKTKPREVLFIWVINLKSNVLMKVFIYIRKVLFLFLCGALSFSYGYGQELQLLPQNDGIDGFYICKLMKKQ